MGRKRKPEEERKTGIMIRIRWAVYDWLEKRGEGSISKKVNEILEEKYNEENKG